MLKFFSLIIKLKKYFYNNKKSQSLILIELNYLNPSILTLLYLFKVLTKKFDATGFCYRAEITFSTYEKYKMQLKTLLNIKNFLIYLSVNLVPKIIYFNSSKEKENFDNFKKKIKNKKDLLNCKINGISVGDLFYDNYLRRYREYTIKFDKKFYKSLSESYFTFLYWYNFFKRNNVKAFIGSHTVYNLGIPIRIAQKKNIPCYIVSANHIFYINKERRNLFDPKFKYPLKYFNDIDKNKILKECEKILKNKFNPNDDYYTEQNNMTNTLKNVGEDVLNTFNVVKRKNFFLRNGKHNVVISSHCFFDSPHAEGIFLFEDYYEWLNFLGKLSLETNYNWYLKKHPHSVEKELNKIVVDKIIKKYPNLILLDDGINNSEILEEGISLLLTVCGSAGYEYSYFKVPVILASSDTSYTGYNFCYQPKNINEYRDAILNFNDKYFNYDREEILKYYANNFLSWWTILPDATKLKKEIGIERFFWSLELLNRWIFQNENQIQNKFEEIRIFVDSFNDQIYDKNFIENIEEVKQTTI